MFICQTFQLVFFGDEFEDMFEFLDQNPRGPNIGWAFWAKHCQEQNNWFQLGASELQSCVRVCVCVYTRQV